MERSLTRCGDTPAAPDPVLPVNARSAGIAADGINFTGRARR
ncbi:hypothetical protein [Methanoculleus sp.]|nr:hypothetical protein [Methanoculleus sp.]